MQTGVFQLGVDLSASRFVDEAPLIESAQPPCITSPSRLPPTAPLSAMPIYEFYCPDNNKLYQFLARSPTLRDKVPACPDNPAFGMERRVSRFAVIGKAKDDTSDDPFAGIDEAKMESFMAEMEGDMAGMDENNPDPRQLGRFMRKMTDLMGDKTPPELREMVKRLEAGEDPEKLEEQFGDMDSGDEEGASDALFSQFMRKVHGAARQPRRDPKLYEMTDYVK